MDSELHMKKFTMMSQVIWMNKIICFIGKSASGKDTLAKHTAEKYGFKYAVSTTSRPIRHGEREGVDYYYLSDEDFLKQDFVEHREYKTIYQNEPATWHYGLTASEIDCSNNSVVAVVDPEGLKQIVKHLGSGENIISIYVDLPYPIRLHRAMLRDKLFEREEFDRREKVDFEKFGNAISEVDYIIFNLDLEESLNNIEDILKKEGVIDV